MHDELTIVAVKMGGSLAGAWQWRKCHGDWTPFATVRTTYMADRDRYAKIAMNIIGSPGGSGVGMYSAALGDG